MGPHLMMRWVLLAQLALLPGCLRRIALRSLADTISEPGDSYARENDPELVRDALPVLLKTMEQLHQSVPDHKGVALALARSFTSYAVAFVEEEADRAHEENVERGRVLYARAKRLLVRARDYGIDGLEIASPGIRQELYGSREAVARGLSRVEKDDVGLLYWTGAAWGSAIACDKNDMKAVGQLPTVEALMRRALALDESFDEGALHEFFIVYDGGRSEAEGGGAKRAREHLERALALSGQKKLSPLVSFAETVDVTAQNKKEFLALLSRVLSFDVDSDPAHRLVNVLAQRRARWLMGRAEDLFAE